MDCDLVKSGQLIIRSTIILLCRVAQMVEHPTPNLTVAGLNPRGDRWNITPAQYGCPQPQWVPNFS
jgi:hypothetical protein